MIESAGHAHRLAGRAARADQTANGDHVALIEGTCTHRSGLLRRACCAAPIGQCVYCGAIFCGDHGELGVEYHEVCTKPACQAKYADVREHRRWVDTQRAANDLSMCAEPGCGERT